MDQIIMEHLNSLNTMFLLVIIAVFLYLLGKGADLVVDEAVQLSLAWSIPKIIVGSTIVSLGTTLPEASVSVVAAINGTSGLALGNAVGSIIADTALILGLSVLMGTVPVTDKQIKKQSNIQVFSVLLLTLSSFALIKTVGGARVTRWMGFGFILMLLVYIVHSIYTGKASVGEAPQAFEEKKTDFFKGFFLLAFGIVLIIFSSKTLIPAVQIVALRAGIPEAVIGATLVAFGTSLPELTTSITAVKKGHGDLAIGNVIGADILNVLFVVGASAAATPLGLKVPKEFLIVQIPFMLLSVFCLKYAIVKSEKNIKKIFGFLLLALYVLYILSTFTVKI